MRRSFLFVLLVALCCAPFLRAEDAWPLSRFHDRLQDSDRLAQHRGFVFVGEISRMEAIRRPRCNSGIENKLAYRASLVLWRDPNSVVKPGYVVEKGFVDCAQKRLPPPFDVGVKVIVYCEIDQVYECLTPVSFSDDHLRKVQSWIDELQRAEGDPVLLQIHHRLHDSLELAPSRPLLLFGQVSAVDQPQKFHIGMPMRPGMRVTVSRLLWGYYKAPEVRAVCPNWDCSGVAAGAKVIVYCESLSVYCGPPAQCRFASAAFTDENVHRVEGWVAEARARQPALILAKVRHYLESWHNHSEGQPAIYRGYVEWAGQPEWEGRGYVAARFVDMTIPHSPSTVTLSFGYYPRYLPPLALELRKPMMTFCYQKNELCHVPEEVLGIIEDSDETFRAIQKLIAAER